MTATPSVLFVCVKNGGKSQIAAALTKLRGEDRIHAISAGTVPGSKLNALAVAAVAELGADMSHGTPQAVTPDLVRGVDRVIIVGEEAQLHLPETLDTPVTRWITVEPSFEGIAGMERMRLVRDDIDAKVAQLLTEML